jgi:hypothetical protein
MSTLKKAASGRPFVRFFVRNGLPDGFVVRLASMDEKHFPTATEVRRNANGSIDVWFDQIFLKNFRAGEYLSYWTVFRERPRPNSRGRA